MTGFVEGFRNCDYRRSSPQKGTAPVKREEVKVASISAETDLRTSVRGIDAPWERHLGEPRPSRGFLENGEVLMRIR
jgi:hypothetical protein